MPPRETLLFKTPDEFTLMRKGEAKIADLRDITMGKAMYGADVRLPGMKFAVMARPAVLGGKVKSFDAAAAMKVPGVEAVHEIEGVIRVPRKFGQLGGIAVVANSTYRRHPRPRCAQDRVGGRPERELRLGQPSTRK